MALVDMRPTIAASATQKRRSVSLTGPAEVRTLDRRIRARPLTAFQAGFNYLGWVSNSGTSLLWLTLGRLDARLLMLSRTKTFDTLGQIYFTRITSKHLDARSRYAALNIWAKLIYSDSLSGRKVNRYIIALGTTTKLRHVFFITVT